MLIHAQFFHNLSRKIGHEIFVKIENTEYLSNQLTFANFDHVMMFPIKNWTFEQILVFSISEMYLPCPIPTVNRYSVKKVRSYGITSLDFFIAYMLKGPTNMSSFTS